MNYTFVKLFKKTFKRTHIYNNIRTPPPKKKNISKYIFKMYFQICTKEGLNSVNSIIVSGRYIH